MGVLGIPLILLGVAVLMALIYVLLYNRLQRLQVKVEEAGSGIDVALEKRYDMLSEQLEAVKKYLAHEYQTLTGVTALRSGAAGEERRLDQQQELSEEAIRSLDAEISRQNRSMNEIRQKLEQNRFPRGRKRKRVRDRDARRQTEWQENLSQTDAQQKNTLSQKISALASAHRDLAGVTAGIDALCEQYPTLNSWMSMDYFQRAVYNTEEHLQAARRLYNSNVSLYNQTLMTIPFSIVASLCRMEKAGFYEVEEHKRTFRVNFD